MPQESKQKNKRVFWGPDEAIPTFSFTFKLYDIYVRHFPS